MWFFVLAARLRLAVRDGFDVALPDAFTSFTLYEERVPFEEIFFSSCFSKLAIGKSDSGGYLWVWGFV